MINIRLADTTDITGIILKLEEIHKQTKYSSILFEEGRSGNILQAIIDGEQRDGVVVLVEDAGKIVGLFISTIMLYSFSTDRVAAEIMFWVSDGAPKSAFLKLWRAWEYWSDNCGASRKQMGVTMGKNSRKFSSFLKRRGYIKVEEAYLKEVK